MTCRLSRKVRSLSAPVAVHRRSCTHDTARHAATPLCMSASLPVALQRLQNPTLIVYRVHIRDPYLLIPSDLHGHSTLNPPCHDVAAAVSARLPSLRSSPAPPAQTFVIDRTGEMPEGARSPPPQSVGQSPRPSGSSPASYGNGSRAGTPLGVGAAAPLPSRFPAYDLDADEPRAGTPEPIKVTRTKKKGSGSGKKEKKRTQSRKTDDSTTQT